MTEQIDLTNAYARLRPRPRKFVDFLCAGKDQTEAARLAKYSSKRPDVAGAKLLAQPLVRAAYDQRRAQIAEQAGVEAVQVVRELARLGYANMMDFIDVQADGDAVIDLTNLTRDQAAAIQEITVDEYTEGRGEDARNVKRVKIKLAEKKGPLELIGKYLKMWTEKHELSGPGGKPLQPPSIAISFADGGPGSPPPADDDGVETSPG